MGTRALFRLNPFLLNIAIFSDFESPFRGLMINIKWSYDSSEQRDCQEVDKYSFYSYIAALFPSDF